MSYPSASLTWFQLRDSLFLLYGIRRIEELCKTHEEKNSIESEKTLEECNSVVFNPLMEEYMGYRKAFIQKAISKEEFENLVETFIKQEKLYDLYEKAITVSRSETESEEIAE